CAIKSGRVYCWGGNAFLQLGVSTSGTCSGTTIPCTSTPSQVSNLNGATVVQTSDRHTCAIVNGEVLCWGSNDREQLGPAPALGVKEVNPQPVPLGGPAVGLALGSEHTCALLADGTVWCWGGNANAELGSGRVFPDHQATAVQVIFPPATCQ